MKIHKTHDRITRQTFALLTLCLLPLVQENHIPIADTVEIVHTLGKFDKRNRLKLRKVTVRPAIPIHKSNDTLIQSALRA